MNACKFSNIVAFKWHDKRDVNMVITFHHAVLQPLSSINNTGEYPAARDKKKGDAILE